MLDLGYNTIKKQTNQKTINMILAMTRKEGESGVTGVWLLSVGAEKRAEG